LRAVFADLGAQIVLPLIFRGNVDGVLALGDKRSGQPFDSDAIDLLRTLANQTAIAVQNARSYQELQALNRDLDAQVRKQTEALRASNTELMHAYDDLKSAQAQLVQAEKMASLGQLASPTN
jgi:GAF domain-containing protein